MKNKLIIKLVKIIGDGTFLIMLPFFTIIDWSDNKESFIDAIKYHIDRHKMYGWSSNEYYMEDWKDDISK